LSNSIRRDWIDSQPLSDPDQALYIEQELERFLKLEDRAVQGELAR